MEKEIIRTKLVSALTTYDEKQSTKRFWNPSALGIYLQRVDDIMKDIDAGADVRAAVVSGFTGSVQACCLRALKLGKASNDEWSGAGQMVYKPASEK